MAQPYQIDAEESEAKYATEAQRPVQEAVSRLEAQLARLYSLQANVSVQLSEVRNAVPESPKEALRDVPGGSPLVRKLGEITEGVIEQQERVTVLLSELEV